MLGEAANQDASTAATVAAVAAMSRGQ